MMACFSGRRGVAGMSLLILLYLAIASQVGEPLLPITVLCALDTSLPYETLRVTVEEKREIREVPTPQGGLTLRDLPAGDLHLLFHQNDTRIGTVTIRHAEFGQFIQIKVRLVEGNAILLEDSRVKGVSVDGPGSIVGVPRGPFLPAPAPAPAAPSVPAKPDAPVLDAAPISSPQAVSRNCPAADERVDLEGVVTRVVDNDSLVLEDSRRRSFTIYLGTATRLRPGGGTAKMSLFRTGQRVSVSGAGAAGPDGECSVGAREIWLRN